MFTERASRPRRRRRANAFIDGLSRTMAIAPRRSMERTVESDLAAAFAEINAVRTDIIHDGHSMTINLLEGSDTSYGVIELHSPDAVAHHRD